MTALNYVPALVISLALATTNAQTPPPAARETPPDLKAYEEAGKLTDPEQKIAALEKVRRDFPTGVYASAADYAILRTLLKSMPDQKDRIRKTSDGIYKAAVSKDKAASKTSVIVTTRNRESAGLRIADQFLTANLFLKDAESYAKRSVDS